MVIQTTPRMTPTLPTQPFGPHAAHAAQAPVRPPALPTLAWVQGAACAKFDRLFVGEKRARGRST